jgi:hypothetical protein
MSSIDSLAELIDQAHQLVLEEETVLQEHFSDHLLEIGERLQARLHRAEEQILCLRDQRELAARMHADIIKLREHLGCVLKKARAKVTEAHEEPSSKT